MAIFHPRALLQKKALWLLLPVTGVAASLWAGFDPNSRSAQRDLAVALLAQVPFFWHMRQRLALDRWVLSLALVASLLAPALALVACASDRGPVPQVRIDPDYPPEAKDRGIEGWVTFSYTVTEEGRVKDIVILDSQPKGLWDRNIIRAVSNWRFQPALKDGKPVETRGMKTKYNFELNR